MIELKVHPAAEAFPLMSEDELEELAADIAANGLRHAVVKGWMPGPTDDELVLVDGRNRLRACDLAETEPHFETLPPGTDLIAYIWSTNGTRRHLTAGQKAMACAKARLCGSHNGATQEALARLSGVSRSRISRAETVLAYEPDLAELVLSGARGLDEALDETQRNRDKKAAIQIQMAQLSAGASDLADKVAEGLLELDDALAAWRARMAKEEAEREEERRQIRIASQNLNTVLLYLHPGGMTAEERAHNWAQQIDQRFINAPAELSRNHLDRCIAVLTALRDQIEEVIETDGNPIPG